MKCRRPRNKGKRRKNVESDEESLPSESSDEEEQSEVDGPASPVRVEPDVSDEENEVPEPATERPGRGARTRAKVRIFLIEHLDGRRTHSVHRPRL